MGDPDPVPPRPTYLMILQRGDDDRYAFLRSAFQDRPVLVMWDRRVGERRQTPPGAPPADRRKGDRRASPPTSWVNLGFLVARSQLVRNG